MISLLIIGSSRPLLFPYCWESFNKYVHYRKEMFTMFHEDQVFPEESKKVMVYLKKNNISFDTHNPCLGLSKSMDFMFKKVKTPYIFYLQDDWEFERPIDVDRLLWVMENNKNVNCIFFNKWRNFKIMNEMIHTQYTYDGVDMCLYHAWSYLPGIWRMSKVREYWDIEKIYSEGTFINRFGNHKERTDVKFCEEKIGAYTLGKSGDYRYIRHIGGDWRMEKWRLENGKPGGCNDNDKMDYPFRAPWLTIMEKRPTYKSKYSKEEIEKILSEEPKEVLEVIK